MQFHFLDFVYLHWIPFLTNTSEFQQSQYLSYSRLWSATAASSPHCHSIWGSSPNLEVVGVCNNHFDWSNTFDRYLSTLRYSYSSHNYDIDVPIRLLIVGCDAAALLLFEALAQTWFDWDWEYVAIIDVWMPWVRSYRGFCCHVTHLWRHRSWLNSWNRNSLCCSRWLSGFLRLTSAFADVLDFLSHLAPFFLMNYQKYDWQQASLDSYLPTFGWTLWVNCSVSKNAERLLRNCSHVQS